MSCWEAADLQHAFGLCCEARVKLEALAGAGCSMGEIPWEIQTQKVGKVQ